MTRLFSMSIRAQLFLIAFIVALPAAGIIIYSGVNLRKEAINEARMETQKLADSIASEQQNLAAAAQQLVSALAQLPDVKRHNAVKVQSILGDILKLSSQYSNIFIANRAGTVWASAVPTKPPFMVSDRRYFKNALATGQLSSGEYVISRATTKPVFNLAYPLNNEHGEIIGVISVGFALDYYKHLLENSKLPPGTSYLLIDHKGVILSRGIDPEPFIGKQYNPESIKLMQEGPDGDTFVGFGIDGKKRFITYRKLRLKGEQSPYMYIRAGIPVDMALSEANKALFYNLALFISFLLLAFFLAWLIGKRSIVDRVALLEKASQRLANGDLQVRISDLVVGGELGSLGRTFDKMARQLALREQALLKSERNYREIFNAAKDALFVHDAESGKIVELNKAVEEMYGYSREEILQLTVQELSSGGPPYSFKEAMQWIRKAFHEGPQSFEWLGKRKNGECFWAEVVLSATSIGGEGLILAVVRDITERKRAEEVLKKSEQALSEAQRIAHIGSWELDLVKNRLTWSDEIYRIFGLQPREFGATYEAFLDTIHPDDRADVNAAYIASVEKDMPYDIAHRIIRKSDGEIRYVHEICEHTKDKSGEIIRSLGIVHDITERRKAEEEQRKLVSLVEMSRDFIGIATVEGKITYLNNAALALVGLESLEEARTKMIFDFFPEHDLRQARDSMYPTMMKEGFWFAESRLRHFKTGAPVDVELAAFAIKDKQGVPISIATVTRDITERKKTEEEKQKLRSQLMQAQKMESIGQLAGGIAHDFNNILAAIIGYGNLVQRKMREDDPSRIYVDHILASSERAANLTQSLLAFSRKQVINPKNVDLNDIVRKVERFLSRIIGEDIELRTTLASGPLPIFADATQIEQLLMNLATNARDAMPTGGQFFIKAGRVEFDDEYVRSHGYGTPGPYVELSVTDTGAGMDENVRGRIFEPFFTTKELGRGTGLGLSIVYGIVKQNNGFINVYSEIGKGTTFRIYLPLVNISRRETKPLEVSAPPQGGTETILLAEDNQVVRTLTRDALTEFGYTVIEAADGEEALQKFKESIDTIQLLIVDVIMPRKKGSEVYEEARKIKPGIKSLFISGYPADIIQKQGVLEEGLNFIQKPSSLQDLLRKIRDVLDQ
jgi:PAS domain S-box-containing protein